MDKRSSLDAELDAVLVRLFPNGVPREVRLQFVRLILESQARRHLNAEQNRALTTVHAEMDRMIIASGLVLDVNDITLKFAARQLSLVEPEPESETVPEERYAIPPTKRDARLAAHTPWLLRLLRHWWRHRIRRRAVIA